MANILVISGIDDGHVPFIRPHLTSNLIIIDPYRIDELCDLSYLFDGKKTVVSYHGQPLTDVKSVWYRKPGRRRTLPSVDKNFRTYAENSLNDHWEMLRAEFQDAHWVSSFYAINKARNKSAQLEIAATIGFNVPETAMTSDKTKAREFIDKHGTVIIKPQNANIPQTDTSAHFFFAKRIDSTQDINLTNLHLAPAIFQVAINAAADVRVTVMGESVFAAIIPDASEEGKEAVRDWRMRHNVDLFFEDHDAAFPDDMRQKCLQLVKTMGLEFGAIDFVLDKQGNYWFIEINPNGQWAFIEEDTGQEMGKAMAELLER